MGIKYVITTVKGLYQEPLEHLLNSMIIHGINSEDIFLSSQDTSCIYTYVDKIYLSKYDINLYRVNIPRQIYEYSFFIACKELLNAGLIKVTDYSLLIHDTAIIKPNHKSKILDVLSSCKTYDIIYANYTGQHNIGLYNYKAINLGYDIYKKHIHFTKNLAIDIEHNNAGPKFSIKQYNHKLNIFYPPIPWLEIPNIKVYTKNVKRVVSTLEYFDIEKYYVHVENTFHPHNIF